MSAENIRKALETALNSITPSILTAWENTAFPNPNSTIEFQQVNLLFGTPQNPTFGGTFYRENGFLQVRLMYPLQVGTAAAQARAELIRSTFYHGASFAQGGVTTVINGTPSIGAGSADGDRWAVPVKIPFFANTN